MANLCFYISDYGYGHASRDIAIIRELVKRYKHLKIYVKTGKPYDFVKRSLGDDITTIPCENDVGIILQKDNFLVDVQQTKKLIENWANSWDVYIQEEIKFCKKNNIDIILSDIPPQPFVIGYELDIPTVAISNFTWYDIYYHLFGNLDEVKKIREFYELATIALILPFSDKMAEIFRNRKRVGLVTRKVTVNRNELRKKYKIKDDEIVIYLGTGKSVSSFNLKNVIRKINDIIDDNVRILASSNVDLALEKIIKIPENETESQNYINMCDMVISKAGYGTISEAISSRIPMFLFKREGFIEDEIITNMVEKMGIGKTISVGHLLSGDWINEIKRLETYNKNYDKIGSKLKKSGVDEIINIVGEVIN